MPPITTSSCPCSQKFEKEKTKLLTVHTPMSSKTREIISILVVLQPALVQPSIATDRCSPSYLIIKKCYFFNVSFIFYHCQFYSTEGAKLSLLCEDEWSFKKKQILPLPSNQRRNPISLCCHIIFPVCLLETERCAVIPGNSESLVLVSNSHQISQVVETFNIIEWRIT